MISFITDGTIPSRPNEDAISHAEWESIQRCLNHNPSDRPYMTDIIFNDSAPVAKRPGSSTVPPLSEPIFAAKCNMFGQIRRADKKSLVRPAGAMFEFSRGSWRLGVHVQPVAFQFFVVLGNLSYHETQRRVCCLNTKASDCH